MLNKSHNKSLSKNKTQKPFLSYAEKMSQMRRQFEGGTFRRINERLYSIKGAEALKEYQQDPSLFEIYHAGYRKQADAWPTNPLDEIINSLKEKKNIKTIGDFGCGEARLAQTLVPMKRTVHSFDLVEKKPYITKANLSNVPLKDNTLDGAVFCLSLMSTDYKSFLYEAMRCLKRNGNSILFIAEIISRLNSGMEEWIEELCEEFHLKLLKKKNLFSYFIVLEFVVLKEKDLTAKQEEKKVLVSIERKEKEEKKKKVIQEEEMINDYNDQYGELDEDDLADILSDDGNSNSSELSVEYSSDEEDQTESNTNLQTKENAGKNGNALKDANSKSTQPKQTNSNVVKEQEMNEEFFLSENPRFDFGLSDEDGGEETDEADDCEELLEDQDDSEKSLEDQDDGEVLSQEHSEAITEEQEDNCGKRDKSVVQDIKGEKKAKNDKNIEGAKKNKGLDKNGYPILTEESFLNTMLQLERLVSNSNDQSARKRKTVDEYEEVDENTLSESDQEDIIDGSNVIVKKRKSGIDQTIIPSKIVKNSKNEIGSVIHKKVVASTMAIEKSINKEAATLEAGRKKHDIVKESGHRTGKKDETYTSNQKPTGPHQKGRQFTKDLPTNGTSQQQQPILQKNNDQFTSRNMKATSQKNSKQNKNPPTQEKKSSGLGKCIYKRR